jgi:hypothetical protein
MSEKTATRISIRLNGPRLKTLLFWRKMSPPRRYDLHVPRKLGAKTRKCISRALGALLRELQTSQIYDASWRPVTKTFLVSGEPPPGNARLKALATDGLHFEVQPLSA